MAVNLALQVGLHVPTFFRDYSRSRTTLTQEEIAMKVQLWFYCIVIHQKAACGLGYPIMVSPDRLQKQMDLRGLLERVSPNLLLEMKLGSLLSRINILFSPSTFVLEEIQDKQSMFARTMMSDIFENQLNELESERRLSSLEETYVNITRLQLRLHCLQDRENPASSLQMAKLGIAATSIIDLIEHLDTKTSLVTYCPHYIYRMTALTASVLLRLAKQSQAQSSSIVSNISGGASLQYKPYFFRTISLLRRMSVDSNDMPSRMAKIFSQLWTIDNLFEQQPNRSPDDAGTESAAPLSTSSPLIVQSRLSMSVLHDCMWRWKDHYRYSQSSRNPGIDHSRTTSNNNTRSAAESAPPRQLMLMSGINSTAQNLTTTADPSTSFSVPSANNLTFSPGMATSDNMMTPSFVGNFSPLGALPWDASLNQEFEMMVQNFPESWPV
ncbi:uncharacterized protein A1O9_09933 [Exophiala aquamarina CBS 119918]|uniref:Transcription factor domain-containing protein n=1 Tax=Exophiala aquamarina CBS 119918 TaxID=1182545 RepID=A0A072P4F0_9EURO|nr:uncharacterized protein A1O9_09933 [Exophiala aquamarina CBS 119918]KEF54138.1 hypothetical protein A1O9_09933 [Exophiala aquamarina CBS 119918]